MIERDEIKAIMKAVSTVVREYVCHSLEGANSRLELVERNYASMPTAIDLRVKSLVDETVARAVAAMKSESAFTEDDARFVEAETRKELSLT